MEIKSVIIIGAGKVAKNLGTALLEKGIEITGIHSKTFQKAKDLASVLECSAYETIEELPEVDLILLCVPDQIIVTLLSKFSENTSIAYTAGAVDLPEILENKKVGVFYPLQTFSENKKVNMFEIPFFIESKDQYFQQSLFDLAWKLSKNVKLCTYQQRLHIHIAAVFTNNFTNHLLVLAEQHCLENNVNFEDVKPLLQETVNKSLLLGPNASQTGPALRNDQKTMELHLAKLTGKSKEIYTLMSQSISELFKI